MASLCDNPPIEIEDTTHHICIIANNRWWILDLLFQIVSNKRTHFSQWNFFNNSSSNFVTTLAKNRLPQRGIDIFHWIWLHCKTASSSDAWGRKLQQWRQLLWAANLHWVLKGQSVVFSSLKTAAVSFNNGTAVDFCSNLAHSRATSFRSNYRTHLRYSWARRSRRKK